MTFLHTIHLRVVKDSDLDSFFDYQQDPTAQQMAAFIHRIPADRNAFDAHWIKIRSNQEIIIKSILYDDQLVGHIAKFVMFDKPELTYWIDRKFWGKGIATQALKLFLDELEIRPIYAAAAKDNLRSIRVLEKCGFKLIEEMKEFANARGKEIDEVLMKLY